MASLPGRCQKDAYDHPLLFFACSEPAFTRWTTEEHGRKCSGTVMVLPLVLVGTEVQG